MLCHSIFLKIESKRFYPMMIPNILDHFFLFFFSLGIFRIIGSLLGLLLVGGLWGFQFCCVAHGVVPGENSD